MNRTPCGLWLAADELPRREPLQPLVGLVAATSHSFVSWLTCSGLNNPVLRRLNLEAALDRGNFADNVQVFRGDIIYVPSSTIADVQRFFERLRSILSPVVDAERGLILLPQIPNSFTGEGKRRFVIAP